MASEEDEALLFLIYQHLKVNGYKKAAKGLEKHVTQVETPEEMSNLHNIYTGWMKLCSLAQHAKEETGNSSPVKKTVKSEPATSEEEGPESKHSNTTEEKDVEAKPTLDPVESSTVDDQLLEPTPEVKTTNEEEKKEEEIQTEQGSAEGFAEETKNVENSSSNSSGSAEAVEPPQGEPSSVTSDQPDSDVAPDPTQTPDPAQAPSPVSEEPNQDADELQQEPEAATAETCTSEQIIVSQTLTTPLCPQEPIEMQLETREDTPEEDPGQTPPTVSSTATAEANEKPAEIEAPSPTDPESELVGENQNKEEKCEDSEVGDLMSSVDPEDKTETPSPDPADPPLNGDAPEMEAAAKEQADPNASIILNIEGDVSEEVAESCEDQTPKKKKKNSGRNAETLATDTLTSETTSTDITSETSTKSPKKKKKDKNKQQEVEEEEVVVVEEVAQDAPSKKKKAKKRKRERNEEEKDEECHIIPVETKSKKKKKTRAAEEETAVVVEEKEHPISLTDTAAKKKKKKKKVGHETEELQSAEQPTEGVGDKDKRLEATDSSGSQLHSTKKKRLRKKLSMRKRLRRQKFKGSSSSCSTPVESQAETLTGKKKLKLMETRHPKPMKRPQPESALDDNTPMKKIKVEHENSSKENLPPKKKKGRRERGEGGSGAMSDLSTADMSPQSANTKKKKKKKKKIQQTESSTPVIYNQQEPAKKKKKNKLKLKDAEPTASTKKTSKKKTISD